MIWPTSMTLIVSHSWSASSRYCVVSTIVVPCCFNSEITSHSPRRLRGSRPVVGSSRNSTAGATIRLAATSARRRMPPEYVRSGRSAASTSPNDSSSSAARSCAFALRMRPSRPDEDQVLAAGQVLVDRRELAGQPDDAAHELRLADDVEPGDGRVTAVGLQQRRQDADRRRLAGAVRAEQPDERGLGHGEVDALQRGEVTEPLDESLGDDPVHESLKLQHCVGYSVMEDQVTPASELGVRRRVRPRGPRGAARAVPAGAVARAVPGRGDGPARISPSPGPGFSARSTRAARR